MTIKDRSELAEADLTMEVDKKVLWDWCDGYIDRMHLWSESKKEEYVDKWRGKIRVKYADGFIFNKYRIATDEELADMYGESKIGTPWEVDMDPYRDVFMFAHDFRRMYPDLPDKVTVKFSTVRTLRYAMKIKNP
jgi:hypothetical protein